MRSELRYAIRQLLVTLAAGADVLVHSVMYPPAIDRLVARVLLEV